MRTLLLAVALGLLLAAPSATAGRLLERVFGKQEKSLKVDGDRVERTTRYLDGRGLRRTVSEEILGHAGVKRVTTSRFRTDGSLASRTIDTRVAREGGEDHDVWHQSFGKDGAVTVDLTLGQVGGKVSAYLLAGQRRFGTASEIHWDRANHKLRYVTPTK